MNKLFATWHDPAVVDLDEEPDAVELLSRARDRLAGIPELERARRLVDVALDEVSACDLGAGALVRSQPSR